MSKREAPSSYDVGFGKPPKTAQFRKGTSGNPLGRPKGAKSMNTILKQQGQERVKVTSDGQTRWMTRNEIALRQLHNKASSGDLKAINLLLAAIRMFGEPEQAPEATTDFHERDNAVMKNLLRRMGAADTTSLDSSAEEEAQ